MDYLVRAIDKDKFIKIFAVSSTNLVEEARRIHNTSKTASAALGRTLTGTLLLASDMKNEGDSITISILGDGPIGGIAAVAKTDCSVKGYVTHPLADVPNKANGKLDVSGLVGAGTFNVAMDLGLKEPYSTSVPLVSGEIAEDFANYLYTSVQVPSAFGLGVLVDLDHTIKAAGGFMVQVLPGAPEEKLAFLEDRIKNLDPVTTMIDKGMTPEDIIKEIFATTEYEILAKDPVGYRCDCSEERVEKALISLGKDELTKMIEEDGGAELTCHFCDKIYHFDKERLIEIREQA